MYYSTLIAILIALSPATHASKVPPKCVPLKSPPAGSVCSAQSQSAKQVAPTFKTYSHVADKHTQSLSHGRLRRDISDPDDCADICGGLRTCQSWFWNFDSDICHLYPKTLEQMGFGPGDDGPFYSDKACRRCHPCKQNGFTNGGFEDGIEPWLCQGTADRVCELHHRGYKSHTAAKLTLGPRPAGQTNFVDFSQGYYACFRQNYNVSFRYMATAPSSEVLFYAYGTFDSEALITVTSFDESNVGKWVLVSGVRKQGSGDTGQVEFRFESNDTNSLSVLVDDIQVITDK